MRTQSKLNTMWSTLAPAMGRPGFSRGEIAALAPAKRAALVALAIALNAIGVIVGLGIYWLFTALAGWIGSLR